MEEPIILEKLIMKSAKDLKGIDTCEIKEDKRKTDCRFTLYINGKDVQGAESLEQMAQALIEDGLINLTK